MPTINYRPMLNRQRWCDKCGGFVEGIYAGTPTLCRCDPKDDRIKKLEAEVERLREKLKQAIEVAHRYDEGWSDASDQFSAFLGNLDKFNTDKK